LWYSSSLHSSSLLSSSCSSSISCCNGEV
jgi:hypothetical protein